MSSRPLKKGDRVVHVDRDRLLVGTVTAIDGSRSGKPTGWITVLWDPEDLHSDDVELVEEAE